MSLLGCFPMVLGGILNVVAPGNYMRKGTPITGEEVYETAIGTLKYTFERIEMFLKGFPLFPAILLILFIINDFESSNIIIIARLKYSIKNDICFIFKLIITRKEIQYLRTILYFNKI